MGGSVAVLATASGGPAAAPAAPARPWGAALAWLSVLGPFFVVVTYQHYVLDVTGGTLVALAAFVLVREDTGVDGTARGRALRIGARYALGSAACLGLAAASWPWSLIAVWPALSLAIVAAAYLGLGPGTFRKAGGRLPLRIRLLLGPYLLGAHLAFLYFGRRAEATSLVVPGLVMGRRLSEAEAAAAVDAGIRAVLDLTPECSEAAAFCGQAYRNVPILDFTAPTPAQLRDAVAFIQLHRRAGIPVYVHCALGYARSAGVIAAYLLAEGIVAGVDEAVERVRAARGRVVVTPDVVALLGRDAGARPGAASRPRLHGSPAGG